MTLLTRADLVVSPRPSGDGVLVYDPVTDTGHVLEGTTAIVFDLCDGTVGRDELVERVAVRTGLPTQRAVVATALGQLVDAGLLEPDAKARLSRRALIGGFALGAAGVALLPVITSVARPRSAGAQPGPEVDSKTATTPESTPVVINLSAQNIVVADTVYWATTQPAHGTVVITNTSSGGVNTGAYATYTPNPGYTGPDVFTYTVGECYGAIGTFYPAPQYAIDACPSGTTISGSGYTPGVVNITVTPAPSTTTTTTTIEPVTPKVTG